MKIDVEQRRAVDARLNELMNEAPACAQPPLTIASRRTAEELLTAAEHAALQLVAFNRQACAWIRGDLLEKGEMAPAPPQSEVLTCAAIVSLNLRLASVIASPASCSSNSHSSLDGWQTASNLQTFR